MTSAIGGMNYRQRKLKLSERKAASKATKWSLKAAKLNPNALGELIRLEISAQKRATIEEVTQSRDAILSYTKRLHGSYCLPRALAVLHYCTHVYGTRPEVIVGARVDPFQAHCWLRAEGKIIDEINADQYFETLRKY
ncbi:lasso peptide biosynthesis B2 protein [Corynebacterium propinquum]|uniref:lasso peptide biosynthesis B2 protein n=1 Tax=Corynebacterium propinquum TaxID=43769 RepID=UPI003D7079B1